MGKLLKTNTAIKLTVGPFVDFSDGVTPETAMTVTNITCELFVDNADGGSVTRTAITLAASASNNDMVHITDDVAGFYSLELTAAQLNFVGRAVLSFTDSDVMCPVVIPLQVVSEFAWTLMHHGFPGIEGHLIPTPETSKDSFLTAAALGFYAIHCILRIYDASSGHYSYHVIKAHTGRGESGEKIQFFPPVVEAFGENDSYSIIENFVLPPTIKDMF